MKAAICYEAGAPLSVEEIELDAPQRGEVKIRLAATAVCHRGIARKTVKFDHRAQAF